MPPRRSPSGISRSGRAPGWGATASRSTPAYLSWRAGQQLGYRVEFIEHANEVNNRMPDYVVSRVAEALNDAGKPIKGSRVLGVGVTFKPGIDDLRESPSLMVLDRLARRGADVRYHDSYVPDARSTAIRRTSLPLDRATIADQDIVVLLTPHRDVDVHRLVRSAAMVFDTRGVTVGIDAHNVVRL